jgi:hypothetical protein
MKIYNYYIIHQLREKYNWRGQREETRYYPKFDSKQQEVEFLRYYIKDKGSFDSLNTKRGKIKRYRVWANCNFADRLSEKISEIIGVNQNKPCHHSQSDITMTISYQSQKDVPGLLNFIN